MSHDIEKIMEQEQRWAEEKKIADLPLVEADSGKQIKALYTPADVKDIDYLRDIGFPGEYPFTRGVYPGMYRVSPWQMRLYAGFGSAEDTNKRWKYLIAAGNMGVGCAFDLPTQMGLDSDDPMAEDEVGKLGVIIDSLRDMEILYQDLPLDKIASSFNINAPCAILLGMYVALAEKQGVPLSSLTGTLANDILCEYSSRGCWIFPPQPALKLCTDVAEYCTRYMPRFYPYNIRGILLREAGATMAQEIGFTFANAIAYIEEVIKRGLDVDEFAPRLSFFFASGIRIFEEAAKYRAARRLWAKIMRERFGAKKPASMLMRFTGIAGGSNMRCREPELNMVRGAYSLLAHVLGGVQGMLGTAMDEPFAIPTERTARLALRTQQICAYEAGVTDTVDPLGGSYYVEALTNDIEAEIVKIMKDVEAVGGPVTALELGYMQKEIAREAYRIAKKEASGEKIVVGVNKFVTEGEEEHKLSLHKADVASLKRQLERLEQVRRERDNSKVNSTLEELKKAAEGDENLMPYIIETAKAYATVGEMFSVLKSVYGTFKEPSFVS